MAIGQDTTQTSSGLKYVKIDKGFGQKPALGDEVKVAYTGYLSDGTLFEGPVGSFKYILGEKNILPGWNEGIAKMAEGAHYVFILPSHLAYGEKGSKDFLDPTKYVVPPNETLIFDIVLKKVKKK